MLIAFIGAPSAGKTTIAAKFFASIKEIGVKSELIVEQARYYIAQHRFDNNLRPNDKVTLTDEDQIKIYSAQRQLETVMKHSSGVDTIVIADSSALNASLYLSNGFLDKPNRPFFTDLKNHYDIVFFCHPIEMQYLPDDPNRIHDLESIKQLNEKSLKLLNILKGMNVNVKELLGTLSIEQRYLQVSSTSLDLFTNLVSK